jgi:predicted CXXCH cytochrome family protein
MSVRHYDAKRMRLELCWMCHPKEEFATTDPHRKTVEGATDGCVFCHDRPPVKGLERAADLYFVSQVKMICLRCHEDLSDQDASHMGKPPTPAILQRLRGYAAEKAIEFPLDRDGRFTCTTCHNAHFSVKDKQHKTRIPRREMCALCHRW